MNSEAKNDSLNVSHIYLRSESVITEPGQSLAGERSIVSFAGFAETIEYRLANISEDKKPAT
jgi:hypothetical protein